MNSLGKLVLAILIYATAGITLQAQSPASVPTGKGSRNPDDLRNALVSIEQALDDLAADPSLTHTSWSFCLRDPNNGRILAAHDPERSLQPASVMKAVVTAALLEHVGPEHRFETLLLAHGRIEDGVLHGALLIRGGGDPSLGSGRFPGTDPDSTLSHWVEAVRAAGIRRIAGPILADGGLQPESAVAPGWTWEDIGNHYAASAAWLSFGENRFDLHFAVESQVGGSAELIAVEAPYDRFDWRESVDAGQWGSGDQAYVYLAPNAEAPSRAWVRGTLPPGSTDFIVKAAVPDPVAHTARVLKGALESAGIACGPANALDDKGVAGNWDDGEQAELISLDTLFSAPLSRLAEATLEQSLNLYAELFLHQLGAGDPQTGLKACRGFLAHHGIDTSGARLCDGSGLTRENLLTTSLVSALFQRALSTEWHTAFLEALPRSGMEGTMRGTGRSESLKGKIRAKTGTMRGVRAYGGYVQGRSGTDYPFCIILNNFDDSGAVRKGIERVLEAAVTLP